VRAAALQPDVVEKAHHPPHQRQLEERGLGDVLERAEQPHRRQDVSHRLVVGDQHRRTGGNSLPPLDAHPPERVEVEEAVTDAADEAVQQTLVAVERSGDRSEEHRDQEHHRHRHHRRDPEGDGDCHAGRRGTGGHDLGAMLAADDTP